MGLLRQEKKKKPKYYNYSYFTTQQGFSLTTNTTLHEYIKSE